MGIAYIKRIIFFIFLTILTINVSNGQQKKYVQYKLKQGETLKVLAKRLGIKAKDLRNLNPKLGKKPKVNSIVIIPNRNTKPLVDTTKVEEVVKPKEVIQQVLINEDEIIELKKDIDSILNVGDVKYIVHAVQKGDTFYSLTRFYNVTQEGLILLNPVLTDGLKVGQSIKVKEFEKKVILSDTIYKDQIKEGVALKMALLLPFKAKKYDTLSAISIFSKNKLSSIVTDFYLGAEIAIDSLRKQGVKLEVNVFDTENKASKINTILTTKNLDEQDVIIGPVYSNNAILTANKLNTPVVFPFYSKSQFKFTSKNLVKIAPEKSNYRKKLTNYIKNSFNKGNLILVGDGKTESNIATNQIKTSLLSNDSINKVHVLKPKDGYIAKERFLEILKPNERNWAVLTSSNMVLVADAVNSLISLPEDTSVTVFTYDKGKAFDKIANLKLAKINLTYVSDYFNNAISLKTDLFNSQFYKKNNGLPSLYAVKGFDITYDVLMRLASGKPLEDTFKEGVSFRVENKFDYFKSNSGMIDNKGLYLLKYSKNLNITRLE
jgi:LysM repeat protein